MVDRVRCTECGGEGCADGALVCRGCYDRLRAVNNELVTALESALADGERFKLSETIKRRMRTAIARAKGEK